MITLFKVLITPFFIGSATLAGRRWGPVVNGLVVGLPLTTGPVSVILAYQYGVAFAARAAAGNLAGQISMCVFCVIYSLAAQRANWKVTAPIAIAAFVTTTTALNTISWGLVPAFGALMLAIALASGFLRQYPIVVVPSAPSRWDLPARMIVATTFVLVLTTVANVLGPQLSGLVSTFPIFGVVFAAFTHAQQGPQAASNLLRGIVIGSVSYGLFFLVIGLCLATLGMATSYSLALLTAALTSGFFYYVTRPRQAGPSPL